MDAMYLAVDRDNGEYACPFCLNYAGTKPQWCGGPLAGVASLLLRNGGRVELAESDQTDRAGLRNVSIELALLYNDGPDPDHRLAPRRCHTCYD